MSPPPEKKDDPVKKDDHGHGEKKTFGQRLLGVALAVLFVVIFLFALNALLSMAFPSATDTVRIVGKGLRDMGVELMRAALDLRVFTQGFFQIVINVLLIAAGIVGSALIATVMFGYLRKKLEENKGQAGAHH